MLNIRAYSALMVFCGLVVVRITPNSSRIVDYKFIFKKNKITFKCHSNSTYADDSINKKFIYEIFLFLNKALCIWYSKKLRSITISSIEVEYMILCQINKIIVWTARWLQELKILILKPVWISIIKNNLEANDLTKDFEHHIHTNYINVQYHYIQKMIELKTVIINHIFFSKRSRHSHQTAQQNKIHQWF